MNSMIKGLVKAFFLILILFSIFYIVSYHRWADHDFGEIDYSKYLEEEKNNYQPEENVPFDQIRTNYEPIQFRRLEENFGSDFLTLYYGSSKEVTEFPSSYFVYIGVIEELSSYFMSECSASRTIPATTVDSHIRRIFGNTIFYQKTDFTSSDQALTIHYLEDTDSYQVTNTRCSGLFLKKGHIETTVVEIKKENGKTILYEAPHYLSYVLKNNGTYELHYHSGLDQNAPVIAVGSLSSSDISSIPKYRYIYRQEKNSYYLEKIESIVEK